MTLYISAIKRYFIVTVLVFVFCFVYEFFSHQVYSPFMYLAFLIPFCGGMGELSMLRMRRQKNCFLQLYHGGVAYLTVGSILQGIVEIYGTTNGYIILYWIVGWILTLIGIIGHIKWKDGLY